MQKFCVCEVGGGGGGGGGLFFYVYKKELGKKYKKRS